MPQQAQAKGRGPGAGLASGAEPVSSKRPKNVKDMAGRQKAAVFLVSLGSDISSEIFKHLREDE
ncbi:MAG: flagellar motor switch protein FliG, partial [Rectinemataceae bacterium]